MTVAGVRRDDQRWALWLSTTAFTVCFAVWTIVSIKKVISTRPSSAGASAVPAYAHPILS